MEIVAARLQQDEDVEVLLWNDYRTFRPGDHVLLRLIELSELVDAAVFIFGEDDKVWFRGNQIGQPSPTFANMSGLNTNSGHPQACLSGGSVQS